MKNNIKFATYREVVPGSFLKSLDGLQPYMFCISVQIHKDELACWNYQVIDVVWLICQTGKLRFDRNKSLGYFIFPRGQL